MQDTIVKTQDLISRLQDTFKTILTKRRYVLKIQFPR